MAKEQYQQGFTLIELLLAMAVFSLVLMVATVGFIGMNRSYTRGAIKRDLSERVQLTNEDVTKMIRVAGDASTAVPCSTNPTGFDHSLQLASAAYAWKDSGGMWRGNAICEAASFTTEILPSAYTVRSFMIYKIPTETSLYKVTGVFTAGAAAGLQFPAGAENWYDNGRCKGSGESPEANSCAVEKFQFIVNGRAQERQ